MCDRISPSTDSELASLRFFTVCSGNLKGSRKLKLKIFLCSTKVFELMSNNMVFCLSFCIWIKHRPISCFSDVTTTTDNWMLRKTFLCLYYIFTLWEDKTLHIIFVTLLLFYPIMFILYYLYSYIYLLCLIFSHGSFTL